MPECKHLKSIVRESDPITFAFCPTCQELVPFFDVARNMLLETKRVLSKAEALVKKLEHL